MRFVVRLLSVSAAMAAVGCGDAGTPAVTTGVAASPCPVGAERYEHDRTAILLGCAELKDGRQIELLASQDDSGAGPCLEISGVDERGVRACGRAPLERVPAQTRPILMDATAQPTPQGPIEVYGGVSASVERVDLSYTIEASTAHMRAAVIRVDEDAVLGDVGIREPFGYFIGEVPAEAVHCQAMALNSAGQRVGVDGCEPYLGLAPDAFIAGADYGPSP